MSKERRSYTMSRIRSSATEFEKEIFGKIRARGIRFEANFSKAIGKPDIALPKSKKAVFLHSDFWHGWQFPRWKKMLPNNFWKEKIEKNRQRDRKVVRTLRRMGWEVLVVWEHSIQRNSGGCVKQIVRFLKS